MKKFLILFFLIFCSLSAFANIENNNNDLEKQYAEQKQLESAYGITFADSNYEYKPIPKELQAQYKIEIERYINTQVPIAKKEIEKEVKKARKLYKKFLNDKNKFYKKSEYIDEIRMKNIEVQGILFKFYIELINITNKYVSIANLIPATGSAQELDLFITPYLHQYEIINIYNLAQLYSYSSYNEFIIMDITNNIIYYFGK